MTKILGMIALAALVSAASAQVPSRSRSAASVPQTAPARSSSSPTFSAPTNSRTGTVVSSGSYGNSRGYGGMSSAGDWGAGRNSVFARPSYPTFTGRIMPAGGGPRPVEPIRASCNCGGRFYDLGYMRFGSGFQFGFGAPWGLPMLQPWMYQAGCNLVLFSPGYRTMTLPLHLDPSFGMGYYSPMGKIKMEPYEDVNRVSVTSYTASKEARKAYEKGAKRLVENRLDEAKELLTEAVELHPEYAAAWTLLGRTLVLLKDYPAARNAFERSLAADRSYVAAYRPLVRLVVAKNEWENVLELTQKGVELDPYDAELKYQLAVAAMELGDHELAREMANRVFSTDDVALYPESGFVLAKAYRALGEPHKAIQAYQAYLERPGRPEIRRWAQTDLKELLAAAASQSLDPLPSVARP